MRAAVAIAVAVLVLRASPAAAWHAPGHATAPGGAQARTPAAARTHARWLAYRHHALTVDPEWIRVHDGDTFSVGPERIRVRGVDTPEIGRPGAANAARRLAALLRVGL